MMRNFFNYYILLNLFKATACDIVEKPSISQLFSCNITWLFTLNSYSFSCYKYDKIESFEITEIENNFEQLPLELIYEIGYYLTPEDLLRFTHTCKYIRDFLGENIHFSNRYCTYNGLEVPILGANYYKTLLGEHYFKIGLKLNNKSYIMKSYNLGNEKAKRHIQKLKEPKNLRRTELKTYQFIVENETYLSKKFYQGRYGNF